MSVWDSIDRNTFENNLAALCLKGKFQDASKFSQRLIPWETPGPENDPLALDAETERQLADDFAFLASTTTWPRDVASAAVQQEIGPRRLRVTIAANQGVPRSVATAFETILDTLARRAGRGLRGKDAQEIFQKTITAVHRNRIFGRLGSPKTKGQKRSQIIVKDRLFSLCEAVQLKTHRHGAVAIQLLRQLRQLQSSIEAAEFAPNESEEEFVALQNVLRTAFETITGEDSLFERLRCIGIDTISMQSREIRELRALGNYWRICEYFVKVSRQHRDWFTSVELNVLEADSPRRWERLKQFVHAEIQLVMYFELDTINRPRFIGASKKPCFLCYCFIRAHASYSICGSHGEVFNQWTVPDNANLSPKSRAQLAMALKCTASDIELALKGAKKTRPGRIYLNPLHTVSKLLFDRPLSVSSSSMGATASRVSEGSIRALLAPSRSNKEASPRPQPRVAQVASSLIDKTSHSLPRSVGSSSVATQSNSTTSCGTWAYEIKIPANHPKVLRVDRMELFIEFVGRSEDDIALAFNKVDNQAALCRIKYTRETSLDRTERIDIEGLDSTGISLERRSEVAGLRFLLQDCSRTYMVELQWC